MKLITFLPVACALLAIVTYAQNPSPTGVESDSNFFIMSMTSNHSLDSSDAHSCMDCLHRSIADYTLTFFNVMFKLIEPDVMNLTSGEPHSILCHVPVSPSCLTQEQKQTVCMMNLNACCPAHKFPVVDLNVNFSALSKQHAEYNHSFDTPPPSSNPYSVTASAASLQIDPFYSHYWQYETLIQRWTNISNIEGGHTTLEPFGASFERRRLHLLRVGNKTSSKKIFINAAQHAREWITIPVVTYIVERFARLVASNAFVEAGSPLTHRQLFHDVEIIAVPLSNPDGYIYSSKSHLTRWQRKNRNLFNYTSYSSSGLTMANCTDTDIGVDLNRNWGVDFGGPHQASRDLCSQTYHGDREFSEVETFSLRSVIEAMKPDIHLDFHSYGQLLLGPFTFTDVPPVNASTVDRLGRFINSSIPSGTQYNFSMGANNDLYAVSGAMSDWMLSKGMWSYTVELPPAGSLGLNGFDLSPKHITSIADDWFHVVLKLLTSLRTDENFP